MLREVREELLEFLHRVLCIHIEVEVVILNFSWFWNLFGLFRLGNIREQFKI
jgi:hypothetical protein